MHGLGNERSKASVVAIWMIIMLCLAPSLKTRKPRLRKCIQTSSSYSNVSPRKGGQEGGISAASRRGSWNCSINAFSGSGCCGLNNTLPRGERFQVKGNKMERGSHEQHKEQKKMHEGKKTYSFEDKRSDTKIITCQYIQNICEENWVFLPWKRVRRTRTWHAL